MNPHQIKRQLRKELLILRAQAYRTEIRQELSALTEVLPSARGNPLEQHPLLGLLAAGSGRLSVLIRWGLRLARWWPLLQTLLGRRGKAD